MKLINKIIHKRKNKFEQINNLNFLGHTQTPLLDRFFSYSNQVSHPTLSGNTPDRYGETPILRTASFLDGGHDTPVSELCLANKLWTKLIEAVLQVRLLIFRAGPKFWCVHILLFFMCGLSVVSFSTHERTTVDDEYCRSRERGRERVV